MLIVTIVKTLGVKHVLSIYVENVVKIKSGMSKKNVKVYNFINKI
jgi:hypothetical protein